jgi:hypothetical protein
MIKFQQVDPEEVPNDREGIRGRVYFPMCKAFLETGFPVAKVERAGVKQTMNQIYNGCRAHARKHKLPIKLFTRGGEVYMIRLDLNADGSPNANWLQENADYFQVASVDYDYEGAETVDVELMKKMTS